MSDSEAKEASEVGRGAHGGDFGEDRRRGMRARADTRRIMKSPGAKQLGRRIGSSGKARTAILKAARELFAKLGFRGTTIRAIGRRAGVDAALVVYYFESKAKLFAAVIAPPILGERLRELFVDGGNSRGSEIVRFYLEHLFLDRSEAITAMLRAALSDPDCVPALRSAIRETLVSGVVGALQDPEASFGAEIVGAQLVGLFISRHIIGGEPLASASVDAIVAVLGPALDLVLDGVSEGSTR